MDEHLIYLRKSQADDPNESVSEVLARHERTLQELAVRLFGRRIPDDCIYKEVASGETIEGRPEIKKVLSRIEDSNVKSVLVVDVARLSRGDWEDGARILSGFKYTKTLIHTTRKTFDLTDQFDYKFFKMELTSGNEFLEYIKMKLIDGREASAKEGNYLGSIAPRGFNKIVIDDCPTLEPNEDAKFFNMALRWNVEENLGWTVIGDKLEALGFKPLTADHWNPADLRQMILNPVNIGMIKWNARKTEKIYRNGKLIKTRPRNKNAVYVKGKHPAIVDLELYEAAMRKHNNQPKVSINKELVNPLAGLIFCKTCGRAMLWRRYTRKGVEQSPPRFLCHNQKHCGTKSCTADIVIDAVVDSMGAVIEEFEIRLNHDYDPSYDLHMKLIADLENQLKKLDERQNELYDLLEDKVYTKETFLIRNKKLEETRSDVRRRLAEARETVPKVIDYGDQIKRFSDVLGALKDDSVSARTKNDLLKTIIKRIEYHRDSSKRHKYDDSKPEIEIELLDF